MAKPRQKKNVTRSLVLVGMLAALLLGGQLALSFLPNIEVVTLFILLSTVTLGLPTTLAATLIFVTLEGVIFGFHTWVLSYYIYWPLFALASAFAKRVFRDRLGGYLFTVALMTALFGVLTSFVDALFALGVSTKTFGMSFLTFYLAGIRFYITHVVANVLIAGVLFLPLKRLLLRQKQAFFGEGEQIA